MKLTPDEIQVLFAFDNVEYYSNFKCLSAVTGLPIDTVRAACRSLKEKGYACFSRGLFTEDGEVAGSGYGRTMKGHELQSGVANLTTGTSIEVSSLTKEQFEMLVHYCAEGRGYRLGFTVKTYEERLGFFLTIEKYSNLSGKFLQCTLEPHQYLITFDQLSPHFRREMRDFCDAKVSA